MQHLAAYGPTSVSAHPDGSTVISVGEPLLFDAKVATGGARGQQQQQQSIEDDDVSRIVARENVSPQQYTKTTWEGNKFTSTRYDSEDNDHTRINDDGNDELRQWRGNSQATLSSLRASSGLQHKPATIGRIPVHSWRIRAPAPRGGWMAPIPATAVTGQEDNVSDLLSVTTSSSMAENGGGGHNPNISEVLYDVLTRARERMFRDNNNNNINKPKSSPATTPITSRTRRFASQLANEAYNQTIESNSGLFHGQGDYHNVTQSETIDLTWPPPPPPNPQPEEIVSQNDEQYEYSVIPPVSPPVAFIDTPLDWMDAKFQPELQPLPEQHAPIYRDPLARDLERFIYVPQRKSLRTRNSDEDETQSSISNHREVTQRTLPKSHEPSGTQTKNPPLIDLSQLLTHPITTLIHVDEVVRAPPPQPPPPQPQSLPFQQQQQQPIAIPTDIQHAQQETITSLRRELEMLKQTRSIPPPPAIPQAPPPRTQPPPPPSPLELLSRGQTFLKITSGGRAHPRFFWCPSPYDTLYWSSPTEPGSMSTSRRIRLRHVHRITPGQNTRPFQLYGRHDMISRSFSLQCNDRSLDLQVIPIRGRSESDDVQIRGEWIAALQDAMEKCTR